MVASAWGRCNVARGASKLLTEPRIPGVSSRPTPSKLLTGPTMPGVSSRLTPSKLLTGPTMPGVGSRPTPGIYNTLSGEREQMAGLDAPGLLELAAIGAIARQSQHVPLTDQVADL